MLAGIFKSFLDVRPGERKKTALMFLYFFLTISIIYILKPIRSTLFIEEVGAKNLRYVNIFEGLFLFIIVAAFVKTAKKFRPRVLYPGLQLFYGLNLVLFWFLIHGRMPYVSVLFYVWYASFSITLTTLFWTLANDLFTPTEARRLFGIIISGGGLGGVAGGFFTYQAVHLIKTEGLLLSAAVILLMTMAIVLELTKPLSKKEERLVSPGDPKSQMEIGSIMPAGTLKLFFQSNYLLILAGLVIIAKMSSTIVDNQFNSVVEMMIPGKEAKTAYFGAAYASLNAISFVMQFLVTTVCLRYLGVGLSLWILPLGFACTSLTSFFFPLLSTALIFKIFDGSVSYSVHQASKEVLFLPLQSDVRYRVKPIIDMLGFRVSKTLAGIYIAVFAPLLSIPDHRLGLLVFLFVPFWFLLAWNMRGAYSRQIRRKLDMEPVVIPVKRPETTADVLALLQSERFVEEVRNFFTHESLYTRKLAATACLAYQCSNDLSATREQIDQILQKDAAMQEEPVKFSRKELKKEIRREIELHENLLKLKEFCSGDMPGSIEFQTGLTALTEESVQRIFYLLNLLHPKEEIHKIYPYFTKSASESARAHAAELLANTLTMDVLMNMHCILEKKQTAKIPMDEAVRIILDMLKHTNEWLQVMAKSLIWQNRLHEFHPELTAYLPAPVQVPSS